MKIAILGCGPTGLLAALAVEQSGHEPVIFSRKQKSTIFGAQFLHRAIDEITNPDPDYNIFIVKMGEGEGYAKKVYGDPQHPVSWDLFGPGVLYGWNLHWAYDKLWQRYADQIQHVELDRATLHHLTGNFPIIYSTIPPTAYCDGTHRFDRQEIQVLHGQMVAARRKGKSDDAVYYNGRDKPYWYRYSRLNGYFSWEYSDLHSRVLDGSDGSPVYTPGLEITRGIKPIGTDCNCFSQLIRIGRFGRWEKQVLTHHAYEQVLEGLPDAVLSL